MSHPVLVTGFGAFGNHTVNPSGQIASALDGEVLGGVPVVAALLDAATMRVGAQLARALDEVRPALVVALGVAPRRPAVSLERVAINVRDFTIPDCDGVRLVDEPVVDGGSEALFTGLPVRHILEAWRDASVPGHLSNTAGTYICNQIFYLACREARRRDIVAGFIHVPDTVQSAVGAGEFPEPAPTVPLAVSTEAVRIAVRVSLEVMRAPGGLVSGVVGDR